MASKVFDNDFLLREIYGYGDPCHRDSMKKISRELNYSILSKVPDQYPYTRPDYQRMHDMNMKESLVRFFQLRRCMCCSRHTHNKPNITLVTRQDGLWIEINNVTHRVPECKEIDDCDCDCRHCMRILSRRISYRSALNTIKTYT